ncbi:MAG TPA: STAS domain-containing protein [Amycolatopsis sp.]|uniref:STAS domain-containing protein n=1 Tax=Amycolatopsis sp. TaxID=37632 RepID=UPI002B49CA71|nr:STAS domain-containing protein [Amycolatopsis sp.]HKS48965.1 STAS domain-containing protein [Amycolatopsis sp.]
MTAVLPSVSTDPPSPVVAVLPTGRPGKALLTLTAHPDPPGAVVVAVRGEVDLFTSPLLRDGLLAHLRHTGPQLIIDLSDVGFFGAAGITVLVTVGEAAMAAGVGLSVIARTRPVLLPLRITGLDGVLNIYPDLAHALRRPGGGPDG